MIARGRERQMARRRLPLGPALVRLALLAQAGATRQAPPPARASVAPHLRHMMTFYTHPDPEQVSIMRDLAVAVDHGGERAVSPARAPHAWHARGV